MLKNYLQHHILPLLFLLFPISSNSIINRFEKLLDFDLLYYMGRENSMLYRMRILDPCENNFLSRYSILYLKILQNVFLYCLMISSNQYLQIVESFERHFLHHNFINSTLVYFSCSWLLLVQVRHLGQYLLTAL